MYKFTKLNTNGVEVMETTGSRFKQMRKEKRLSQEEMADILNLSKSAISAVENDKSFVSLDVMRTLFVDLGVNLNWLIVGKGSMFNANAEQFEQEQDVFAQKVRDLINQEFKARGL